MGAFGSPARPLIEKLRQRIHRMSRIHRLRIQVIANPPIGMMMNVLHKQIIISGRHLFMSVEPANIIIGFAAITEITGVTDQRIVISDSPNPGKD